MWPDYMYAAVDAVDDEHGLRTNYNPLAAMYFVSFIFVITFFITNLYVGAVIKKFNDI
jgi:hypothetical protein